MQIADFNHTSLSLQMFLIYYLTKLQCNFHSVLTFLSKYDLNWNFTDFQPALYHYSEIPPNDIKRERESLPSVCLLDGVRGISPNSDQSRLGCAGIINKDYMKLL